jgi:Holliday junction resolvase RusA-like endonuclease
MIKITIPGSPVSKSNYKAFRKDGRAYMASSGNDARYKAYEDAICLAVKQNYKGKTIDEECILIIKLFFKNNKKGDAHNYPKSICDGLEKSQIIANDYLFKPVVIEEYFDKENPRVEVEIYKSSEYKLGYNIKAKEKDCKPLYIKVPGNPVTKSNFKLQSASGKAWMPSKGKHAKYSEYETLVAWESLSANRGRGVIDEPCIFTLDLYFKTNHKRDVHNYTKSICDGIEKGNVITNDKHFKPIYINGSIDSKNPRAEIGIYPQSKFEFGYKIEKI